MGNNVAMTTRPESALSAFSPAAQSWFRQVFGQPTDIQQQAWAAIADHKNALVIAPTGSGKTLAAFFAAIDRLCQQPRTMEAGVRVLYISPIKALAADIERNLRAPLIGIATQGAAASDFRSPSVGVRTGDTPASERRQMQRQPPDILITTPESFYLLLTSQAREILRTVDTVIVDEIHAIADSKRGSHLALSLARLDALGATPAQRIGLSATVNPAEEVAGLLGGSRGAEIVAVTGQKQFDITIEVPHPDMSDPLPQAGVTPKVSVTDVPVPISMWPYIEQRISEHIAAHRTSLIFVNSRKTAERLTNQLNELANIGPEDPPVARAHHGSVSKERRREIEEALKAGTLPAVVATSSLELGIDMGAIDLVIQVEAPYSVASGLQRIGRAGHSVGETSRAKILPKYRGDLLIATAVANEMLSGHIEPVHIPKHPLDVLAQQIVAAVAMDEWVVDDLFQCFRSAYPYRNLPERAWLATLDLLTGKYPADKFAQLRPKIIWDRQTNTLKPRSNSQRLAIQQAGTIPDRGYFTVNLVGEAVGKIGELDEEMVYESRVGDVFSLGASSWRIAEITHDRVLVTPAPGQAGKPPFWIADNNGRSATLAPAISTVLRAGVQAQGPAEIRTTVQLDQYAQTNIWDYIQAQLAATGVVPDAHTLVVEVCRDDLGDVQLLIHSPYGARVHAPWSMLISDAITSAYGFDLKSMYNDDGLVCRLPLGEDDELVTQVIETLMFTPESAEQRLREIITTTSVFASRFRECAARALLLPSRDPRRRAPLWQQRQRGAQLMAAAADFPDFPISLEAARECLEDVFDVPALLNVLGKLNDGSMQLKVVHTHKPSPFAANLLFSYVAEFMYQPDTPLAERRAQVLSLDATILAELLGSESFHALLDDDAVAEISAEVSWRTPRNALRSAEQLADALQVLGPLTETDIIARGGQWAWAEELQATRRAIVLPLGEPRLVRVEDSGIFLSAFGTPMPPGLPLAFTEAVAQPLALLARRYARCHGPFTTGMLAAEFGTTPAVFEAVLQELADHQVLARGSFTEPTTVQWCDQQVLRRIRLRTLARLRQQAEAVPADAYVQFLSDWHGIKPLQQGSRAAGSHRGNHAQADLIGAIDLLAGCPIAWSQWESQVFPSRIPSWQAWQLDELVTRGEVLWCGSGALPRGDGHVVLVPSDAPELLPEPTAPPSATGQLLLDRLHEQVQGQARQVDLAVATANLALPSKAVQEAIWELIWCGWLTSNTVLALRQQPARKPTRSLPTGARKRPALRRLAWDATTQTTPDQRFSNNSAYSELVNRHFPGSWQLRKQGTYSPTEAAVLRIPWILQRHGVLTRDGLSTENWPGGFAAAYQLLKVMEEQQDCLRGYFIDGLGGAQFATMAVISQLRDYRQVETQSPLVVAATDPAQPFGAALPWPAARTSLQPRPARRVGALVVLRAGQMLGYIEASGTSASCWAHTHAEVQLFAQQWIAAINLGMMKSSTVRKLDGLAIFEHPHASALLDAGFVAVPQGYRYRKVIDRA